jgi:hypothetical protein
MIGRLARLTVAQQVLAALAAAVVLGILVAGVPALGDVGLIVASLGLVAAIATLASWLWQHQHTTDWTDPDAEPRAARGADARIASLAHRIDAAVSGDPVALTQVHQTVSDLARERLRYRRGLTADGLTAHTSAARAALGADLAAYLTNPPTTRLTADRLGTFITTLEEL